jgi:hypothetical protein
MKYKHFKIQKFLTNKTDIIVDRENKLKIGDILLIDESKYWMIDGHPITFDDTEKWLVVSELKGDSK